MGVGYHKHGETEFTTLGFGAHELKVKWKEKENILNKLWKEAKDNSREGKTGSEVLDQHIKARGAGELHWI